jgi:unsaturated chondroitin disaccharide hydrolase
MLQIDSPLDISQLKEKLAQFWLLSGQKILAIEARYTQTMGTPVFTVAGKYTSRGWTEWTQGFQYGSALIQYDVTGQEEYLHIGRKNTVAKMATHISHIGVHDHGFNNVSTYGQLLRLMNTGKIAKNETEKNFYELALKISGAVQASRWTQLPTGGFIHSFNGPHSLFVDTIRSCRALILSHLLGHKLQAENDKNINLLHRAVDHIKATATYAIYYGEGRDSYDIWGRTAHESIFNTTDGAYRCPNSQQGYTGFSTWTRGLAWAMLGFAEQLELIQYIDNEQFDNTINKDTFEALMLKAATATSDFYIQHSPTDGIPYWDTGAPNLYKIDNYLGSPANPYNQHEPVDSSAAAIAAQGLLRLGSYLLKKGKQEAANNYWQAGLQVANRLFESPYLSQNPAHEGLILHSIYHRPNGWDYTPPGAQVPNGEASMWGDYHARELALYLQKNIDNTDAYYYFSGFFD